MRGTLDLAAFGANVLEILRQWSDERTGPAHALVRDRIEDAAKAFARAPIKQLYQTPIKQTPVMSDDRFERLLLEWEALGAESALIFPDIAAKVRSIQSSKGSGVLP